MLDEVWSDFMAHSFEYSRDDRLGYIWATINDAKVPAPGAYFVVVVRPRPLSSVSSSFSTSPLDMRLAATAKMNLGVLLQVAGLSWPPVGWLLIIVGGVLYRLGLEERRISAAAPDTPSSSDASSRRLHV
jgi:hypothetical protein